MSHYFADGKLGCCYALDRQCWLMIWFSCIRLFHVMKVCSVINNSYLARVCSFSVLLADWLMLNALLLCSACRV